MSFHVEARQSKNTTLAIILAGFHSTPDLNRSMDPMLVVGMETWMPQRSARIDKKNASSAVEGPADAKPATSAPTWEHCGAKLAKALNRKAVRAIDGVELENQKEIQ